MLLTDVFAMTTNAAPTTMLLTAATTTATAAEHPFFNEMVAALRWCQRCGVQREVIAVNRLRNRRNTSNTAAATAVLNIAWTPRPATCHTSTAGLTAFLMPPVCAILFLVAGTTTA
jgi:hypothetical protein